MTIYFTASIIGKRQYLSNYLKIISLLKEKGHTVISDHIISTTEPDIHMETREKRVEFQKKLEKWITGADCVIAETSFPSISVGYEISLALSHSKPVLILYSEGHPPSLLANSKDEKLICERYAPLSLKEILYDFLNYVQNTDGIRFTFFITSKLASYLEEITKDSKIPKAVYIRKLIEEDLLKRS